ncbi:MAG TPA: DUF1501 domain-containing protein [Armatimonadota bacterium]|jgi:uncharacterized protein (DUF1501 family)
MSLSRRDFLRSTLWLSASCAASSLFERSAFAQAASQSQTGKTLVVLQLTGGNDGLNTVIPYADDLYYKLRPSLAYGRDSVILLSDTVGLNPSLSKLRSYWDQGNLAVVQGVGYPKPNRSHFESMDIWHSADPTNRTATGWLGRYLDELHDTRGGLQGLSLGDALPHALIAGATLTTSVQNLDGFQVQTDEHNYHKDRPAMVRALQDLFVKQAGDGDALTALRQSSAQVFDDADRFQESLKLYKPAVAYPAGDGGLGRSLQQIAQLIVTDSPARVYYTFLDGFDTHAGQKNQHGPLLGRLAAAVDAFFTDLRLQKRANDVVLLAFSEFGRRAKENGSKGKEGTDHGKASVVFLLGDGVKGGLYGAYPSLSDLDDGDLVFNTDFRSIYASLLDRWMGVPSDKVLGGTFPNLTFL